MIADWLFRIIDSLDSLHNPGFGLCYLYLSMRVFPIKNREITLHPYWFSRLSLVVKS